MIDKAEFHIEEYDGRPAIVEYYEGPHMSSEDVPPIDLEAKDD